MSTNASLYEQKVQTIEQAHIVVLRDVHRFMTYNKDVICPHFVLSFTLRGSARGMYDMQEMIFQKNDIACVMPNHVLHPLESSEDYKATLVVISQKMFKDLHFHSFSHDSYKFNHAPTYTLTCDQAKELMAMIDQLETTANYTEQELPHRYGMLLALVSVIYEYLNYYRREQDREWEKDRYTKLFNRFCDLVVSHFRESREVSFYADRLNLSPKYFSKVIRTVTNGISASDWIDQYVVAQAKRILDTHPTMTIEEIAYRLGFSEQTSFCRFFKRVTGVTAKQYASNGTNSLPN